MIGIFINLPDDLVKHIKQFTLFCSRKYLKLNKKSINELLLIYIMSLLFYEKIYIYFHSILL